MSDDDASHIGKYNKQLASFAKAIGISRTTLNTWFTPATRPKKDVKLRAAQNRTISEKFDFPVDWPPWTSESLSEFRAALAVWILEETRPVSNPLTTAKRFLERLQLQGVEINAHVDFAEGRVPLAVSKAVFEGRPVQQSQIVGDTNLYLAPKPRSTGSKTKLGVGEKHLASVGFSWNALNDWAPPLALNVDVGLGALRVAHAIHS